MTAFSIKQKFLAISAGVNILIFSAITGHANTSITLNYYGHRFNSTMNHFKEEVDELNSQSERDESLTNERLKSA